MPHFEKCVHRARLQVRSETTLLIILRIHIFYKWQSLANDLNRAVSPMLEKGKPFESQKLSSSERCALH